MILRNCFVVARSESCSQGSVLCFVPSTWKLACTLFCMVVTGLLFLYRLRYFNMPNLSSFDFFVYMSNYIPAVRRGVVWCAKDKLRKYIIVTGIL
ncbi:hypothetical protein BDV27DRAFT_13161 [Aspergillus caelatus]|uniref:Uncharacterized protein n=1 Tax=Aspergillus caelatus TaxID=61420 RepID=A0A5N7A162_9EURO|nr:uncharacterized protein BDV27DRAFT_13161 [Aspergillus caelatus]KAE8362939.1 hypothetical protein BDV27DRAFT_13161 [Aspergillus caelatus]